MPRARLAKQGILAADFLIGARPANGPEGRAPFVDRATQRRWAGQTRQFHHERPGRAKRA